MNTENMDSPAAARLQDARQAVRESAAALAAACQSDEEPLEALWDLVRRARSDVEMLYAAVAASIYVKTGAMPHEEAATGSDQGPPRNLP